MKYEVEDGVLPNARPVRFGFDPRQFPNFSWRGYAVMSPAQVSSPAERLRLIVSILHVFFCRFSVYTCDRSQLSRSSCLLPHPIRSHLAFRFTFALASLHTTCS